MNNWSARRKRFTFFIVILSLIVLLGVTTAFLFYESPTCFDSKRNGDETGVDCGGSCQLLCPAQSLPLVQKGDPRIFEVLPGFYSVVAVVENPNVSGEVLRARYSIKLFTPDDVTPSKVIEGQTYVPTASTFAIFQGPFNGGDSRFTRAVLEWQRDALAWQMNETPKQTLVVRNTVLSDESSEPRVTATLANDSLDKVSNIELVALVSNESGNIVAASKTIVESVPSGGSVPVVFTWPRPFGVDNVSLNIVTRVFPDRSLIK